jgi:mannose-6-phosphate isomerase-like protein (cupin superfamily)
MKSKIVIRSTLTLLVLVSIFLFGFYSGQKTEQQMSTQIFRRADTRAISKDWGQMDIYTSGQNETYGTEGMFTALTDVLPGKSAHPAHRHGEEEFLVITRGTGIWSLNGAEIEAKSGDLIYANPWDFHGLLNTGSDTLTFFVIKWKNKGIDLPAEPVGDHGN